MIFKLSTLKCFENLQIDWILEGGDQFLTCKTLYLWNFQHLGMLMGNETGPYFQTRLEGSWIWKNVKIEIICLKFWKIGLKPTPKEPTNFFLNVKIRIESSSKMKNQTTLIYTYTTLTTCIVLVSTLTPWSKPWWTSRDFEYGGFKICLQKKKTVRDILW